ncbi:hypothetical protein PR202_gb18712 [Eleusine coracana subsp. coracana]|uniref:Pentatricopeptide repeat-containing protein n=1 Tax=Eleusine coracana subsp. coracana TaxID=191504 RepID=A0AAV5F5M1_ELECO|nr:hypothetical protein PR202_gb18712 [Eleusine coracana subsp. coracana]
MISAYAKARRPKEALALFDAMPVQPDEVTMVSVVSACTALGDLATGERLQRYINSNGFGWMVSLRSALMDMYAKCGCLSEARSLFDGMAVRSLASWNTLISAYASHGDVDSTISLFHQMLADDSVVKPDGVTLLAVLTAYAHKGCVEGRTIFNEMQRGTYGKVELTIEHYGCMVDLLGRAGRLEEAYKMIEQMPILSNDDIFIIQRLGSIFGNKGAAGDRRVLLVVSLEVAMFGYDGIGSFASVQDAMDVVLLNNQVCTIIRIAPGVHQQQVYN